MFRFGYFHATGNLELVQHLQSQFGGYLYEYVLLSIKTFYLKINLFTESEVIKSERVFEVMSQVDRGKYVGKYTDPDDAYDAYVDCPQSIGFGAVMGAPHMVINKAKIYIINTMQNRSIFVTKKSMVSII